MGDVVHAARWTRSSDELVERCRCGDDAAWVELVERYHRLVFAVARRNGLSEDDAADVTQATFTSLVGQIAQLQSPGGLGAWLSTVARRHSWRVARARQEEVGLTEFDGVHPQDPMAADAAWIEQLVESLPEPCRALMIGLFLDVGEPTYAELALRIGRPIGSIGPTRARCLERLRRLLQEAPEPVARSARAPIHLDSL